ncbi:cupredoxin domain-containing protein [Rhodoferax sp.]|uniref:cupredoxin domain-containing protein n=1 Tax=Rhodoferax sp. TaxID=50421 RepID=UPI0028505926|nr:cupredoxin domain-containing protein [Rhodoferax sp.]MDR3372073.1 cupredoxin domain-containing protein [Rhodoferax sp.]
MKNQLTLIVLCLAAVQTFAATDELTLTLKNHTFEPKELKVPADKKVKILVVNQDATPAEFESKPLNREKVIPGKSTGVINVGPLKPGRYGFVEEYHETETGAQGTIVVE